MALFSKRTLVLMAVLFFSVLDYTNAKCGSVHEPCDRNMDCCGNLKCVDFLEDGKLCGECVAEDIDCEMGSNSCCDGLACEATSLTCKRWCATPFEECGGSSNRTCCHNYPCVNGFCTCQRRNEGCSSDNECCSRNCGNEECQCFPEGSECSLKEQCCSLVCSPDGICLCGQEDQKCILDSDCCDGLCGFRGICKPCQPSGSDCNRDVECCSGNCRDQDICD